MSGRQSGDLHKRRLRLRGERQHVGACERNRGGNIVLCDEPGGATVNSKIQPVISHRHARPKSLHMDSDREDGGRSATAQFGLATLTGHNREGTS